MKDKSVRALSAQMAIAAMLMTSVGLAVVRLAQDLGFNLVQQGNIVSSQFWGQTLGLMIGGAMCDKYGRQFVIRVALIAAVFVSLAFGFAGNYPSALIATFLLGAVSISLESAIVSSSLDFGENSRNVNDITQAFFSVGALLVPILYFIFFKIDIKLWRPVYSCMAAAALLCCLFSLRFTSGRPMLAHGDSIFDMLKRYVKYLTKPRHMLGAIMLLLYVSADVGLWAFAPALFEAEGYGLLSGIIATELIWVSVLISRVLCTLLFSKAPIQKLMLTFSSLCIISYSCILFLEGPAAIACIALTGIFSAPMFSLLTSFATKFAEDNSSSYIAFIMAVGSLGPAVLGTVSGLAGQVLGPRFVVLPPIICLAAFVAMQVVFNLSKKRSSKATPSSCE